MALTVGPIFGLTGLILSLPALIDNTIDYAINLRNKIDTFKNGRIMLKGYDDEYKVYSVQLEASLRFVKDISPFLSPTLNETLQLAIFQLNSVLTVAKGCAGQAFDSEGKLRRVWFTLYGRSALEKSLREVNRYHDLFLRSLHYTVLFGGTKIDTEVAQLADRSASLAMIQKLKAAITDSLTETGTKKLRIQQTDLPPGSKSLLHPNLVLLEPSDPDQQPILIEKHYDGTGTGFALRKFRELARVLSGTSVEMGILPCQNYIVYESDPPSCDLVFSIPHGVGRPRTLRDLLSSPQNKTGARHSLTERINLAVKLATGVMYVHMAKLVHKNIRPENILVLEPASGDDHSKYPYTVGTPILMGFDFARLETDYSDRRGTDEWEKNIYMHPERQGEHTETSYNMLHDIYSLGVVLLEIALWRSFVIKNVSGGGVVTYEPNTDVCRFRDSKSGALRGAKEIQKIFVEKANTYIPRVLGEKYRDIVVLCLNCLDGGFDETEDMLDADGIIIGLVFIQKILGALKEISI